MDCLYKAKSEGFKPKLIEISVQAYLDNNIGKKIGVFGLNLSEYINNKSNNCTIALRDCPDKSSKVNIAVYAKVSDDAASEDMHTNAPNKNVSIEDVPVSTYSNESKPGGFFDSGKSSLGELTVEDYKREKEIMDEYIHNLHARLQAQIELAQESKEQFEILKKKAEANKSCKKNLKLVLENSENKITEVENLKNKYKIKYKSKKNTIKDLTEKVETLSQEINELKLENHRLEDIIQKFEHQKRKNSSPKDSDSPKSIKDYHLICKF